MSKKPEVKASIAKAAEAVTNEVKAFAAAKESEMKKPEAKEEPKKDVVKEIADEAANIKETAQKAARKATTRAKKVTAKAVKEKVQPQVILQFGDEGGEKSTDVMAVVEKVKGIYVAEGHRESSIKSLQIYMKPQDYKAYYVINDKMTGDIDLF